jgi:hypothetical protein
VDVASDSGLLSVLYVTADGHDGKMTPLLYFMSSMVIRSNGCVTLLVADVSIFGSKL